MNELVVDVIWCDEIRCSRVYVAISDIVGGADFIAMVKRN